MRGLYTGGSVPSALFSFEGFLLYHPGLYQASPGGMGACVNDMHCGPMNGKTCRMSMFCYRRGDRVPYADGLVVFLPFSPCLLVLLLVCPHVVSSHTLLWLFAAIVVGLYLFCARWVYVVSYTGCASLVACE